MKLLFLALLFSIKLFGCSLCTLEVPMVHINLQTNFKDNTTTFEIQWEFSQEFTQNTLRPYDLNQNDNYEENELNLIKQNLEEYIQNDSHLTFAKYFAKNQTKEAVLNLPLSVSNSTITYKDKKIYYYYSLETAIEYKLDHKLYFNFFDKGNYFHFVIQNVDFKHPLFHSMQLNNNDFTIFFYDSRNEIKQSALPKETLIPTPLPKVEEKSFTDFLSVLLENTKNAIQNLLKDIKENNSISAYFWLLLFSFVYGIIHAIGPGHGKSLVSAYFLGNNNSIIKAMNISLLIGIVHTFSAFILTLITYYIIQTFFSTFFTNVEKITTQISALIIVSIALYLFYKKTKKPKIKDFKIASNVNFVSLKTQQINHTHTCGCNACKTDSTDLMVILAAGIIPCPGTVTIFIFTLSMGVLFVGFLSAVFMSLGMSLIIFFAAYLSIKIRSRAIINTKLKTILEYGSLVFILLLGMVLFFIS